MKTKKQFTKQLLSIFLCVAMVLAYVPSFSLTAFAEVDYVASVTDKEGATTPYTTFAEAVTAAQGKENSTLTLLDNITLSKEQDITSGKFTLDLNGKQLAKETGRVLHIDEGADLTIEDSGTGGSIEANATVIVNSGTLTVEGGTLESSNIYSCAIDNNEGAKTTVNGGVLKNYIWNKGELIVESGEISGRQALINSDASTAYISGGEFTGTDYVALDMQGGKVEITGGSFTGKDDASGIFTGTPYGEYTVYFTAGAELILGGGEFPNGFVVSGTTAKACLGEGYHFYADGSMVTLSEDQTVISGAVQVKAHYVASVTEKDGNLIGNYKTLAEAVTAAQDKENSILTLLDNITLTEEQDIYSGKFTLDLNGKIITTTAANGFCISDSSVELTIDDSGEGGKIESTSTKSYATTIYIAAGTVNINGGIIAQTGDSSYPDAIDNGGTLNVYGGEISSTEGNAIWNSHGTANIYGGTIKAESTRLIYNKGGEFNIYGGVFEKGSIWDSTLYNSGGTISVSGGEFKVGLKISDDGENLTLNEILAKGCYFYDADGKKITVSDTATEISGYVQVKEYFAASVTDKDGVTTSYATFAEAVTAAQSKENSTLTLLNNITLSKEQNITSGKFTLDLNGKQLVSETDRVFYIYEGADLTVEDSVAGGIIEAKFQGFDAICNYGTLLVKSGTVKSANIGIYNEGTLTVEKDATIEGGGDYFAIDNRSKATIKGGVLKSGIANFSELIVNDGEISGINALTSYEGGTATIKGGTFTGTSSAALNLIGGKVEITGGSFTGKDTASGFLSGTPYGEWTVYFYTGELILKGGEFPNGFIVEGTTAKACLAEGYRFYVDGEAVTLSDDQTVISGALEVKEHYVASVTDEDGNLIGNYKTLAEAVTAAQDKETSILTLLDNITLTSVQYIQSGKFTLDLNGKIITTTAKYGFFISGSSVELTIDDSGEGGKFENISTEKFASTIYIVAGTVNINGGIIAQTGDAIIPAAINNSGNGGTLNVYGGEISSTQDAAISNSYGTANIYGGTIKAESMNLIYNDGELNIYGGVFENSDKWGYTLYNSGGTISVSGGEFKDELKISDDGQNLTLNGILAEGCHFRDTDGKLIEVADDATIISGTVKVSKGADLSEAVITLSQTEYTYNGLEKEPTVTVTIGGKVIGSSNYTVNYIDNVDAGKATVTVTAVDMTVGNGIAGGLGGGSISNSSNAGAVSSNAYTGQATVYFRINPASIEDAEITLTGDFSYTGSALEPSVTVILNGKPLVKDTDYIVSYSNNIEVGEATVTIKGEVNFDGTVTKTFNISYLAGAPDATVSGTKGKGYWYIGAVTLTAPNGYMISKAVDGTYGETVFYNAGQNETVTYYLKNASGQIAQKTLDLKIDLNDPTAEYNISENGWKKFVNTISFGLFCKDYKEVEIRYSDENSGIATKQYYISDKELTDTSAIDWLDYTDKLSLNAKGIYFVYIRVIDNAGHEVILNSEGVVIYEDSKIDEAVVYYTYASPDDVVIEVDLNGNTVKDITINDHEIAGYWSVDGNKITLKANYFSKLPVLDEGSAYPVTVYFDPMGVETDEVELKAELKLIIQKADGAVSIISDISKQYDGKPVEEPTFDKLSDDGTPTIEYKVKGEADSTYTTNAPKNAGDYVVRITVTNARNYKDASATAEFTISKKPLTVTIKDTASIYGNNIAVLEATDSGILNGDNKNDVYKLETAATSTSDVGTYAITVITLDSNYDITFENGKYEITKREITITVEAKDTIVNTELPAYTYKKVEGLVGEDKLLTEPSFKCDADITKVGEYEITAYGADAGGNYTIKYESAKLTVQSDIAVDAAKGYEEEIKDLDPAAVTSNDKAELDEILEEINTLLDDENTTDNGRKALEETKEKVEELIKKITDVEEAVSTDNIQAVEDVTTGNVTPEDKTDLESARSDLENAIAEHGNNMTDDEKSSINDEIKRIDDALKVIGNVEAVEELISKLPDTIKKEDEAAVKAADDAYSALSEYEKSIVDKDMKKALDNAKATIADLNKPSPDTGDSNIWLLSTMLFVCGTGILGITLYDRKRRTASKR